MTESQRNPSSLPPAGNALLIGAAAVVLSLLAIAGWQGSPIIASTTMDVIAASVATFIGIVTLLKHRDRDDAFFLIVGTGFLLAGVMDGWHALVGNGIVEPGASSSGLSCPTWFCSRMLIAVTAVASCWSWKRGPAGNRLAERGAGVVAVSVILLGVSFAFLTRFSFASRVEDVLHPSTELIPGFLLAIALYGFSADGFWRKGQFAKCLIVSLVLGIAAQIFAVLRTSGETVGSMFAMAHLLQLASYLVVAYGSVGLISQAFADARRLRLELEQTTEEFDRASEGIDAFARWASHDLRTPLRHIFSFCGFVHQSASERLTDSEESDLTRVMEAATSMSDLLDGLSRFAKMGAASLQFETLSLSDIVQTVVEQLPADQQSQVRHQDLNEVTADRSLLTIVLQNLIENGLKYVKDRPAEVTVTSRVKPNASGAGQIQVTVADNGIGIENGSLKRIFEPGIRAVGRSEYSGSGFGLATSARVVAAHQGKIWVESEPGKGSAFHFTIPVRSDENTAPVVSESQPRSATDDQLPVP